MQNFIYSHLSGKMLKHFFRGDFRRQTVDFAKGFWLAVFDELVWPTDPLDRCVDAGVVEIFDHGCTKAIEQHVVFEGANHFTFFCKILKHGGIEWFDEAWVNQSDG